MEQPTEWMGILAVCLSIAGLCFFIKVSPINDYDIPQEEYEKYTKQNDRFILVYVLLVMLTMSAAINIYAIINICDLLNSN